MIFINTKDDPIIPPKLVNRVKDFVLDKRSNAKENERYENSKDCLLIEQKYGGHLGFYEGGLLYPNTLTWLDR